MKRQKKKKKGEVWRADRGIKEKRKFNFLHVCMSMKHKKLKMISSCDMSEALLSEKKYVMNLWVKLEREMNR